MAALERALDLFLRVNAGLGAGALIVLALMVSIDVTVRALTGQAIIGVFELSGVALVVATFLPLGLMQFRKLHIRVDIISSHARGRTAALLDGLDAVAGLIVFGLLLWIASDEFMKALRGGFLLRGMIQIPTAVQIGFIVYGSALILLALLHALLRSAAAMVHPERFGNPQAPSSQTGA